jgi:aspartyl aminopeptidase
MVRTGDSWGESAEFCSPSVDDLANLSDLAAFISASPSPFHLVATVRQRLESASFRQIDESGAWPDEPGRYFAIRDGSIVAWDTSRSPQIGDGFRLLGAHSDSPNLRIRPRPDRDCVGFRQIGVEIYGGALLNSWLDRDLGVSGRMVIGTSTGPTSVLVKIDESIARIPQLAIHLDRAVNTDGLKLDPQQHMVPVWGTGRAADGDLLRWIADRAHIDPSTVLASDLMLHDLTPPSAFGADSTLFAAPRIDNQLSCHAGVSALLDRCESGEGSGVPVLCIFDHEEVGSESASGAAGSMLESILERIAIGVGLTRDQWFSALANSACLSTDGAHATHPNYAQRHEPDHQVVVNAGPVLKHNANMRYATDAPGVALVTELARSIGVPLQHFVTRGDMPCGSTIGPTTSARLGIRTVDIGVAQLSMHSAREMCGSLDPLPFRRLLAEFLATSSEWSVNS